MNIYRPLKHATFGTCVNFSNENATTVVKKLEHEPTFFPNLLNASSGLVVLRGPHQISNDPSLLVRISHLLGPEVEDYYQDHQDIFRRPEDLYLVEALVETRAEADSLVAQIGEGESLKKLAVRHSVRPAQLWEKPGTVTLSGRERLAHPRFYHAAQQAQDGELVGPLEVDGGFSVFEVVGRSGGEVLPLSEVDKRARALAGRQKREQLFDELVDGLMDRHERAITIYPAELEAALPDSFLKRL